MEKSEKFLAGLVVVVVTTFVVVGLYKPMNLKIDLVEDKAQVALSDGVESCVVIRANIDGFCRQPVYDWSVDGKSVARTTVPTLVVPLENGIAPSAVHVLVQDVGRLLPFKKSSFAEAVYRRN